MNYFALAGAILSTVLALNSLTLIVVARMGKRKWNDAFWGPIIHTVLVAAFATAAVAWFNVAVGA